MVTTQTLLALQALFQTRAAVKLLADRQEKKTIIFSQTEKPLKTAKLRGKVLEAPVQLCGLSPQLLFSLKERLK